MHCRGIFECRSRRHTRRAEHMRAKRCARRVDFCEGINKYHDTVSLFALLNRKLVPHLTMVNVTIRRITEPTETEVERMVSMLVDMSWKKSTHHSLFSLWRSVLNGHAQISRRCTSSKTTSIFCGAGTRASCAGRAPVRISMPRFWRAGS